MSVHRGKTDLIVARADLWNRTWAVARFRTDGNVLHGNLRLVTEP
jgi:hypothetical protein